MSDFTDDEVRRIHTLLRSLLVELRARPMAYVVVIQDQTTGALEVVTNAKNMEKLPLLLMEAAEHVSTPGRQIHAGH